LFLGGPIPQKIVSVFAEQLWVDLNSVADIVRPQRKQVTRPDPEKCVFQHAVATASQQQVGTSKAPPITVARLLDVVDLVIKLVKEFWRY
jgi:hypothetical protein